MKKPVKQQRERSISALVSGAGAGLRRAETTRRCSSDGGRARIDVVRSRADARDLERAGHLSAQRLRERLRWRAARAHARREAALAREAQATWNDGLAHEAW